MGKKHHLYLIVQDGQKELFLMLNRILDETFFGSSVACMLLS